MAALVFSTVALLAIVYFDLRPKWLAGERKTLWLSCAFVLAGYVILALASFGVKVMSPVQPLIDLVGNLTGVNI